MNLKQTNENLNLVLLILLKITGAVLVVCLIVFGVVVGGRKTLHLLNPTAANQKGDLEKQLEAWDAWMLKRIPGAPPLPAGVHFTPPEPDQDGGEDIVDDTAKEIWLEKQLTQWDTYVVNLFPELKLSPPHNGSHFEPLPAKDPYVKYGGREDPQVISPPK